MNIVEWLQRKRHAKGFGIHSPFAFDIITKIIPEGRYRYNAYSDIYQLLSEHNTNPEEITPHNRLCFRLVNHFKASRVLEINSEKGINTLFITASDKNIVNYSIEKDASNKKTANQLLNRFQRQTSFIENLDEVKNTSFDAIFIHPKNSNELSLQKLLSVSSKHCFWVVHPIKTDEAKQFWKKIVNEESVRITFHKKHTGIVFLNPSYHKFNYLI